MHSKQKKIIVIKLIIHTCYSIIIKNADIIKTLDSFSVYLYIFVILLFSTITIDAIFQPNVDLPEGG